MKRRYFEIRDVLKKHPGMTMYFIFGERSNGKTYSCLDLALEEYAEHGWQAAYIRRSLEDVKTKYSSGLYTGHISNGRFDKFFGNLSLPWNSTIIKNGCLYPRNVHYSESGKQYTKTADKPLLIIQALSTWQHSKGISFPDVKTIIFDEFLTNDMYLPDEVNTFQNIVSSFVRDRGDVKIFMLGNTVSRFSPYFTELGLTHVSEMNPGDSHVYTSGDGKAKYLLMFTDRTDKKDSDKYFSVFNNNSSKMITGGGWEMSAYPIVPSDLYGTKPIETFFISYSNHLVRGDIVEHNQRLFILFRPSTQSRLFQEGNARDKNWYPDKVCYTDFYSRNLYDRIGITNQRDNLSKIVSKLVREGSVYFATNNTGDLVSHYFKWSSQYSAI